MSYAGNGSAVYTYNAGTWSGPDPVGTGHTEVFAVSCSSPSFCMAVGRDTDVASDTTYTLEYSNGTWAAPVELTRNNYATGISCPAPTRCIATAQVAHNVNSGEILYSTARDGNRPQAQPLPK